MQEVNYSFLNYIKRSICSYSIVFLNQVLFIDEHYSAVYFNFNSNCTIVHTELYCSIEGVYVEAAWQIPVC